MRQTDRQTDGRIPCGTGAPHNNGPRQLLAINSEFLGTCNVLVKCYFDPVFSMSAIGRTDKLCIIHWLYCIYYAYARSHPILDCRVGVLGTLCVKKTNPLPVTIPDASRFKKNSCACRLANKRATKLSLNIPPRFNGDLRYLQKY